MSCLTGLVTYGKENTVIGNLIEYTGAFEDFCGKRGIILEVKDSIHFKDRPCYKISWLPPVNFGGRIVKESTFIAQDLKIISEVLSEGE